MKHKLFILMTIFGLLLFSNCQMEDNAIDADNHSKFSMKKISFEEMKSKPKAVEALNKIRETKKTAGAQAKLVYDSANDFYVDTDEIIYIEKGGDYHSYTFAVYRDIETPLFENLVMSLQKDGSYSATLVSYNLTEQERADLEKEKLFSLEGKLSAKVLDPGTYNPEYLLDRTNCYNVNVATCSWHGVHIAGPRCKPDGVATIRVCYEYEEPVFYFDDTATGDTGGGAGSGGGTGNPNPNPDPTPDTDPEDEEPEDELGDVVTVPVLNSPSKKDRFIVRINNDPIKSEWWNNPANDDEVATINAYLDEVNPDFEFAEEALNALIQGGEVDFDYNIIYLINMPCQEQFVKDIMNISSPFTNVIRNTFDNNDKVNLKFTNGSIPGGNAFTAPPSASDISDGTYTIQIKLDNDYLTNATDLSIIATTLHEIVHAYLIDLYIKGELTALNSNYDTLLNAFFQFYKNSSQVTYQELDDELHNAMVDFMNKMANSLYNYAQSKGMNDVSAEYCLKMAWSTNYGTTAFETILTQEQQIDYGNTGVYEQDNMPEAKGTSCD